MFGIISCVKISANENFNVKGVKVKVGANATLQFSGSTFPIDNSVG
jgi:hypothetical protein